MAAMKLVAALLALVLAAPASADPVARWRTHIDAAAARFGLPAAWIEQVMRVESGGRTSLAGRPITSRAGAMGLMQLMPATWRAMRAEHGLGADPHDPHDNIMAGAAYLRRMHARFGYPGLFAAYNAGPGRYADHLSSGRPLPGETRAYLAALAGAPSHAPALAGKAATDRIFFPIEASVAQPDRRPGALFVALRDAAEHRE